MCVNMSVIYSGWGFKCMYVCYVGVYVCVWECVCVRENVYIIIMYESVCIYVCCDWVYA